MARLRPHARQHGASGDDVLKVAFNLYMKTMQERNIAKLRTYHCFC